MILTNDIKQNLQAIKLLCLRLHDPDLVLARLTAAQAILESRLLGIPSKLAKDYNNLFGIKGKGTNTPESIIFKTKEQTSKGWIEIPQAFAWNKSLEDSLAQHKKLLNRPRYAPVLAACYLKSFDRAAKALVICGYATDSKYAEKLIGINRDYLQDMDFGDE